jgi:simple sugar transport system ATP-binding protein
VEFIRLNNISKSFAGVKALQEVNLTLRKGEVCCLIGENGSGKSTLIKVISGVHAPDSGEIQIDGRTYKRLHPIEAIREGIEVIYQDFSLFPNLTVAENLALDEEISANRRLINWKEVFKIAREALDKINVQINLERQVSDLSVADRQLVAISRALLQNARLIIMDEPTTALTQKEVRALFEVINNLKKNGISILFVSHKLDEVLEIADRIVILRNGMKVFEGEAGAIDRATMVQYMVGRDLVYESAAAQEISKDAPVILEVKNLYRRHSFYEVSFTLRAGEILGITGLLGSGRTALALSLFGILPAESGSIYIEGKPVKLNSVQDAIKYGIGYVPEDRLNEGLFLKQAIGKNIVVRVIDKMLNTLRLINRRAVQDTVREWLERLSVHTPSPDLPANSLSGGNQQRIVLAKWLASRPKILILNGPTVGIDVGSKAEIHEIIRDLARQGMALIVISDDVPELLQVCHRILLMKKGRIVEEFLRQNLTEGQLNTMLTTA